MRHIVALSGGKDSTAMALRLAEVEPRDYQWVCTPTGDELPEMLDHWTRLGDMLGKPILPVTGGVSLQGLIRREKMLPNNRARFCTRILKLEPFYRWLAEQAPCTSYVGLRADEEGRAGMTLTDKPEMTMDFPMRRWGWGEAEVWDYLNRRGVQIPNRTDCARCYHQRLGEWWRLWRFHPKLYADAEWQEAEISIIRERQHTFRNATRDTWPAGLTELRERFEAGHEPRGAVQQGDMFSANRASMKSGSCRVCSL